MKILPNYNIIGAFNYQNSISQKNNRITFRGCEQPDNDIFEHSNKQLQENEAAKRIADLENMGIEKVVVDGNKILIENLNGDFSEAEIPEIYFENSEDRQQEAENWLLDGLYGHPTLGMPFELLDVLDNLGIITDSDDKRKLEIYRNALSNGIKMISYNWTNGDVNVEIDNMPYKFKTDIHNTSEDFCEDLASQDSELYQMISNIKESGKVAEIVNCDNKDILIPSVLNRVPDIKENESLIRNGNTKAEQSDINFVLEKLQSFIHCKIDPKEIKVIKYLEKPFEGYDNNYAAKAYGYYDKDKDKTYLYTPSKNKIDILFTNNYIKSYNLADKIKQVRTY